MSGLIIPPPRCTLLTDGVNELSQTRSEGIRVIAREDDFGAVAIQ